MTIQFPPASQELTAPLNRIAFLRKNASEDRENWKQGVHDNLVDLLKRKADSITNTLAKLVVHEASKDELKDTIKVTTGTHTAGPRHKEHGACVRFTCKPTGLVSIDFQPALILPNDEEPSDDNWAPLSKTKYSDLSPNKLLDVDFVDKVLESFAERAHKEHPLQRRERS